MPKAFKSFTLIELIIVIGVLAILTATALPAFGSFNQRKRFKSSVDSFVNDVESMKNKAQSAIVHTTAGEVDWALQYNCNSSNYSLGHGTSGANYVSDVQKTLANGTFQSCLGSQVIYFQRISGEVYGLSEDTSKKIVIRMSDGYENTVTVYKSGQMFTDE